MSARPIFAVVTSLISIGCADQAVSPIAPLENAKPLPIISGQPDQGAHPYVGLLVFDDADGPAWSCTGALLSSTVVLTAGHCTDGAVAARIWMDEVVQGNAQFPFGGTTSYEGTPSTYPGFCVACNSFSILRWLEGDVGIVVLSEPVPTSVVSTYVQLPASGLASTLANNSEIRHVGYGDQFRLVGGGRPGTGGSLRRLTSVASLISGKFDNSENLIRLSSNSAKGKGGTCYGDSGAPNLVGTRHVTIAVTSYGTNGNCTGSDYSTRIDVASVLSWIHGFLD